MKYAWIITIAFLAGLTFGKMLADIDKYTDAEIMRAEIYPCTNWMLAHDLWIGKGDNPTCNLPEFNHPWN